MKLLLGKANRNGAPYQKNKEQHGKGARKDFRIMRYASTPAINCHMRAKGL